MKTWKKHLATLLIVSMMIIAMPTNAEAAAKSKIKLSKKKLTMNVGDTKTLKLKGTKKKPKWSSSKKSVATVTKKGKIKAKKKGTTVITAKLGKKKYTCKVKVNKPTKGSNGSNTPASSAPSQNNTTATPTQNPGVTPTNKPGVTPTEKPDDTSVIVDNYQTLANYIRKNGQYNAENEYYYISDLLVLEEGDFFDTIRYHIDDGSFDFATLYTTADGVTSNLFMLTVKPSEIAKGAVSEIFVYSTEESTDLFYVDGEVTLSSLTTTDQSITYTSTNISDTDLLDTLCALAESSLAYGLQSWSAMLRSTELGLTLKDLGFTSYEG